MTHDKSCMFDALSFLIDTDIEEAVKLVGHDGRERGFHSQEIIEIAEHHGYDVTEIQRNPQGINPKTHEEVTIHFPEGNDSRFMNYLMFERGILIGSKLGRSHAVAWDLMKAVDPANNIKFDIIDDGKLIESFFVPLIFLRLS